MVLLVVREYSAAHLRKHSHECKKVVAVVGFGHALHADLAISPLGIAGSSSVHVHAS